MFDRGLLFLRDTLPLSIKSHSDEMSTLLTKEEYRHFNVPGLGQAHLLEIEH